MRIAGNRRAGVVAIAAAAAMVGSTAVALADVSPVPVTTWGTNGRITAVLPVGDRIFVGGTFSAIVEPSGMTHPAANLAVINASTGQADLSWQASTDGAVTALAISNGRLYAGGGFSTVNGTKAVHLVALDASSGAVVPGWKASASSTVDALAVAGTSVYAAGNFTKITDAAGAHTRAYVAKLDATTGTMSTTWAPAANARVRALAVSTDGARVFLGGDFTSAGATSTNKVAAVSASSGAVDTAFKSVANNGTGYATVYDLVTDGSRVYEAVGGSGGACTAVSASTGAKAWSKHSNGNIHGVRLLGAVAYCGGHFSGTGSFDGQTRSKLAAVDLTSGTTTSYAPVINSALGVWSLGVDGTRLYAGGDFTKVSGVNVQHYAQFAPQGSQTVPLAPTNLAATPADGVIHLTWSPPSSDGGSPITRYKVYRAVGTGNLSLLTSVGTGTTYDDTAVTAGTAYRYVVTAVNSVGESAYSNEATATAQSSVQTVPNAPTGLTATATSSTSVHLAWSAPYDGGSPITGYPIYRGTASGSETLLTTATGTSYDDTVASGATYYYRVSATNGVGEGPQSSEVSVAVGATVPGAPTLSGTVSNGAVTLNWTAPASDGGSPITKYVVSRTDVGRLATVGAGTFTYTDTTVTSGTTYTYQVRAVNAVGAGPYSNKVPLTP